jgi:SAM-dependent methyltransferase
LNSGAAYDSFAPVYDDYTAGYQAASWTGKLLALAQRCGAPERGRLLDVGCGTGKSFLAMRDRGWEVVGCDLSPAMIEVARQKAPGVQLEVVDARQLPALGAFDLVWSLNDTLNNLLEVQHLREVLEAMKANLAPGGVVLFDLNTESLCRALASEDETRSAGERRVKWTSATDFFEPGGFIESWFGVEGDPGATELHRQRHFPESQVLESLEQAGLSCLEVYGDYEGEQDQPLDEERHQKAIYLARWAEADHRR